MLIYLRKKNKLVLKKMKSDTKGLTESVVYCYLSLLSANTWAEKKSKDWFRVLKISNFDPNPASFSCHQLHWEDWSKQINHLFYDCITVLQIPRSLRINFHLSFIHSFFLTCNFIWWNRTGSSTTAATTNRWCFWSLSVSALSLYLRYVPFSSPTFLLLFALDPLNIPNSS